MHVNPFTIIQADEKKRTTNTVGSTALSLIGLPIKLVNMLSEYLVKNILSGKDKRWLLGVVRHIDSGKIKRGIDESLYM